MTQLYFQKINAIPVESINIKPDSQSMKIDTENEFYSLQGGQFLPGWPGSSGLL